MSKEETIIMASDKPAVTSEASLADLNKTLEEKPGATEETQEAEEDSTEETDAEELEAKSEESEEEEKVEKPKKKGGFQKRIDKLNVKLSAKDQEIEYWRQQALREQSKTEAKGTVTETVRDMSKRPKADDFKTVDDYHEALTEWKVDQRLDAERVKTQQTKIKAEFQERNSKHFARIDEFKSKHDDFDELMENTVGIMLPAALQESIIDSDQSAELMYELAKDPKELKRICSLSPLATAREIGKIEARLTKVKPESSSKKINKTEDPKPITPVRAKGSVIPKGYRDDMSMREYDEWRKSQSKRA